MDELKGLQATKRFKTKVRALGESVPVVELLAFLKEHSDPTLYLKLKAYVNETTLKLKVPFADATASLVLSQIKPEENLCTASMVGVERNKDMGGTVCLSYPDKITFHIKGTKQKGTFAAFIRQGLVVPWYTQEVTISG